jgi:LuxR family transcriptional regulator, maltose regulon positive regulatory protein
VWPPAIAPRAFLRPRLHARLAPRFDQRLIIVQAGAGFGKTTLLAQALAENALDPRGRDVYLGCDPGDSSASTLLAGLRESLGAAPQATETSIDDVCAAVWSAAPTDVCFIIDDAHALTAGSAGEAVLAALVDHLPINGHLVVASRRAPALHTSRLRAVGRCDAIGEDDLRLDDRELARLADAHGIDASALAGLAGWPALAELTATVGGGVASTFVSEEVLSQLDPDDQRHFATIVAIGGGDAETIAAACAAPVDIGRFAALPLVSTDEQGALRPHALWSELIRGRLSVEQLGEARRRAATALRERGAHAAAFELLAADGDWPAALPALFDACNDQVQPPWADVMARWHSLIPAAFADEAEVAYLRAMIERAGDLWSPTVLREFAIAFQMFRDRNDIAREVTALVRACYAATVRDDREFMAAARSRGEALIAVGVPVEPIVLLNDTWRAYAEGRFDDVIKLTDDAFELEPRLRHFPGFYRVAALLAAGRADEAMPAARAAAEFGAKVAPALATGWAMSSPALVSLAIGDIDVFTEATLADLGPRFALSERVPYLAVATIAAANTGAIVDANSMLERVEAMLPSPARRGMIDGFRALAMAAVSVAGGDEAAAADALDLVLAGDLSPVGAGMGVRWYPAHAYLFHPQSREMLDAEPSGSSRRRILDGCRALLRSREGQPVQGAPLPILDDVPALIAAFGVNLAVELVVRIAGTGARAGQCIARLVERAPDATRGALRDLAGSESPTHARSATALLATIAIPPPHRVRIELLGPPRLLRDGELVDDANWRRARVRQLIAVLVVHRHVRRQRAGTMLWPEADEDGVSANLRMTLSYVQALLEPHRAKGDASWFVQQESGSLVLGGGSHLGVDVWDFEDALDHAADARRAAIPSAELDQLLAAIEVWRGEPLADVLDHEWAGPHLRRLNERFVNATVRAAELLAAAGRDAEALEVAERGLRVEPWSEALHRVIIAVHVSGGQADAARRALSRCDSALAEMGTVMSASMLALQARVEAR